MSALLKYLTKTRPDEIIQFYGDALEFLLVFNVQSPIDEIEALINAFDGHYPSDLLDEVDAILLLAIHQTLADYGIVVNNELATKTDWFMLAFTVYGIESSPYLELIRDEVELTDNDKEMLVNILINHGRIDEFRCYEIITYVSSLLRSRLKGKMEALEFKAPMQTLAEPDVDKVQMLKAICKRTPPPTWLIQLITQRQLLPGIPLKQIEQLLKDSLEELMSIEIRRVANELIGCAVLSDTPLADRFKVAKALTEEIYREDLIRIGKIHEVIDLMLEA